MKPIVRHLLLACLPLVLTLGVAISLHTWAPGLPVLLVRADLGNWLLVLGCLLSLILVALAFTSRASERRCQNLVTDVRREQRQSHRQFLQRLDHELKNPLTAMRAALANLSDGQNETAQAKLVQDINHQAGRMSRLVADLRKLAELEERPIEKLPVDLADLLAEVVETAQSNPACAGRTIKLVVSQVPWPLPPAVGDRDLLGLAFYNLVDNALKFTTSENPVEVRASEDGHSLIVEVADTGPGIPADDLPRIFDELYRGANARGFEGSGLGLALVQRIVARHGGSVAVRSRPGRGTVFTVHLPQMP